MTTFSTNGLRWAELKGQKYCEKHHYYYKGKCDRCEDKLKAILFAKEYPSILDGDFPEAFEKWRSSLTKKQIKELLK